MTIGPFRGDFRFLSNFHVEPMRQGYTVEHFFQAAKAASPIERAWVMQSSTPGEAKRRGRQVTLRADWDAIKEDVMLDQLRTKFYLDRSLQNYLLATGTEHIEEINTWNDRFWGTCNGVGQNILGFLLMEVRTELRAYFGDGDEDSGTPAA